MKIWTGLLMNGGYVTKPELVQELSGDSRGQEAERDREATAAQEKAASERLPGTVSSGRWVLAGFR